MAQTRRELCTDASKGFTDPQLLDDSAALLQTFRSLNSGDNDDRPAKRRKTLSESASGNINRSMYEQLMVHLNGSFQDSPVLNLANLHNIIQ